MFSSEPEEAIPFDHLFKFYSRKTKHIFSMQFIKTINTKKKKYIDLGSVK